MTLVELTLYALVAAMILAFFLFFFWRTRRVHEQQTLETVYQGSFIKLCDQLEKDLTGCGAWRIQTVMGAASSLFIERVEGQVTYDVRFETGEVVRTMAGTSSLFPFRGEREGILKTLEFVAGTGGPDSLTLKISLKSAPPIELSHDFPIRISIHTSPGFFQEPQLGTP